MNVANVVVMSRLGVALLLALGVHSVSLAEEREVLFYRNPMNPAITSPVPAQDEMGMDYIPVYADEMAADGATVTIDPAVVQNLGVRTETVTRGKLWRRIDTVGYVGYDEKKISHVHMRADGWIEKLVVRAVGERVQAGDVLFEIYAPALANAQEEFLQALRLGQRELIRASRDRLQALGIDRAEINTLERTRRPVARVVVRAPQDGVVSELNVREGMYVTPGTAVMTLADLSSVWLLADVFERQAQWVQVGQPADVALPYVPGETQEGQVEFIYPNLDPKTRTLRVRMRFDNPGEVLRPNMYANVQIFAGPRDAVLSVPREALIRTGRANRVIVAEGEGRFRAVEVVPGMESGDWVEIKSGLSEGEQIVVSGQFLIDSEASIRASALRMQGATEPVSNPAVASTPEKLTGTGTVQAVMAEHNMLTLDHQPIEALGWPAMSMDFLVDKTVDLTNLQVGDQIKFELVEGPDGRYEIGSIQPK